MRGVGAGLGLLVGDSDGVGVGFVVGATVGVVVGVVDGKCVGSNVASAGTGVASVGPGVSATSVVGIRSTEPAFEPAQVGKGVNRGTSIGPGVLTKTGG